MTFLNLAVARKPILMMPYFGEVGDVDDEGAELVDLAEQALHQGISQCAPGKQFSGTINHKITIKPLCGSLLSLQRMILPVQ